MTDAERAEVSRRGVFYGFWVFATCAAPLSLAIVEPSRLYIAIATVLVTIHIVCIPIWQKMLKQFLCSTAWAREQGITPEQLRLFVFRA